MKKFFTPLFLATALLAGCSKTTPEPEPAEQAIGGYNVDKITESIKFANSSSELSESTNYPIKNMNGELSLRFDVAKVSANSVSVVLVQDTKPTSGAPRQRIDPFGTYELKKPDNGAAGLFDMYDGVTRVGSIGNSTILYEEQGSDKDSLGRQFTYTFRISGKKAN
ncbi:MAG: hypothetical protein EAZ32_14195 [Cytophagia bacterium]|nr:MAG: hypothetical protein EAZ46_08950 [Runella sp.]TAG18328.1 MAG: hypothetical protein EAZ38_15195 [Cytophagales bacterium]TAG37824.1 MAG: hypothetical protein EAZ32_14195 [Cytophagia bacterium]TAG59003.1 MAG: hypothetical protein EAZ29_00170 [Runella slithyformis]TAG74299.1 MAG: hypothetical protein EAZ26_02245 [Runella slithyformis]